MPRKKTSDGAANTGAEPAPRTGELAAESESTEPELPPISADLMSALESVEAKFYDLPVSERRILLLNWLRQLRNRLGYFQCIGELVDAFIEVHRGLLPPLFKPLDTPGRPPLSMIVEDMQSAAAMAMDALMLAGKRKEEAARIVARRVGYSVSDPSGRKKVAQWRDDLARAAKGKGNYSDDFRWHAQLHEHYRAEMIQEIKSGGQDAQRLAARKLARLDRLRQMIDREKGGDFSSK